MSSRLALGLLAAGWIARALASTDGDVDAGIAAYGRGEHEEALRSFDAAHARLGEQPEIHFDRGLALQAMGRGEEAREAFERGTESDEDQVRGSSHYQIGNLAFDAEQWDEAIAHYQSCLRAVPGHENAKWNLELALQKKREQEKQEQEKQEQEKQEQEKQEQEQQEQEQQEQEEQENEQDAEQDGAEETGGEQPEGEQEQEQGAEPKQPPQQPDEEHAADAGEEPPSDSPGADATAPQPIDRADIDAALDQLDAADQFMLGRPGDRPVPVEKDW
jgi:Ca-activated chloride channel family protein